MSTLARGLPCRGVVLEWTLICKMAEHLSMDFDTGFDFLVAATVAARFDSSGGQLPNFAF